MTHARHPGRASRRTCPRLAGGFSSPERAARRPRRAPRRPRSGSCSRRARPRTGPSRRVDDEHGRERDRRGVVRVAVGDVEAEPGVRTAGGVARRGDDAEAARQHVLGVGQHREGELAVRDRLLGRLRRLGRHGDELHPALPQGRQEFLLVGAQRDVAVGAPGAAVEHEDGGGVTADVRQRGRGARRGDERGVGCFVADRDDPVGHARGAQVGLLTVEDRGQLRADLRGEARVELVHLAGDGLVGHVVLLGSGTHPATAPVG